MAMIYAILNPPVRQPLVRLAVRVSVLFAMALLLHMSALSVLLSLRETDFMVSSELTSLAYASTPTSASAPAQGEAAVSHTMQQPRVCELPAQVSLAHVSRLVLFGKHPTEAGLAHTVSRFRDRIQRAFLPRPDVASRDGSGGGAGARGA
ncbi:hypothetical protein FVE85_2552 [Porphyridium purpureum]|uniref:Uncharacterized protein n=1 Tax=Porphyridium purpureum TaxID=35688 RepID=A0A5J4YMB6_PORPP|nr:hypothetical protein FVE85_2552 [Porphyridium purpureum]|eukprot:POR6476..scf291_13